MLATKTTVCLTKGHHVHAVRPSKSSSSYPTHTFRYSGSRKRSGLFVDFVYLVSLRQFDTLPNPLGQAESVTAIWNSCGHGGNMKEERGLA